MADEIVRIEADAEEIDQVINTLKNCDVPGHIADTTNNPHQVTKEQVGLGNVDNVATKDVLAELVDSGAKNLLKITGTSQTIRGVTFTVNDDETVSVDGTNSTSSSAVFYLNILPADTASNYNGCILTGCPQGGSTSTYRLSVQLNSGSFTVYASDIGGGSTIHDVPSADCRVAIVVYPGATVNNLIFKPMICTKAAWDISQAYVPYRPSYDELVARIEALEQAAGINTRSVATLATETAADATETEGGEVR